MLIWLTAQSIILTLTQYFIVKKHTRCSADRLQWTADNPALFLALYPFTVFYALQCGATLRLVFIKSWRSQFLPEQFRKFVLGDVRDHVAHGEAFESEDSPFEEQPMETERPLVIDPTEGEFPTIPTLPSKLALKGKSEIPKRSGFDILITDDGTDLQPKASPLKAKAS